MILTENKEELSKDFPR